jgi:hypothetical protein
MEIKLLSTDTKGTPCSECKAYSFPITSELLEDYFFNRDLICPECKSKLDLWGLLIRHFEWGFPSYLYAVVGGNDTWAEIIMKPNEIFILDLEKIGVPENAKILQIGYTPQEKGLFPLEIHGNYPLRHFVPNKIHLFGKTDGEVVEQTRVLVTINWVENNDENELWTNLIEAVEAFSIKKFQATIIPANVSVESRLTPIISEYLEKIASKQKVSDFLSTGATYSHQLNILLPLLTTFEKFPKMPDFLRGNLNSLRSLRNQLAHKGKLDNIDKSRVANLLCSAIFGLTYLNILDKHLKANSEKKG